METKSNRDRLGDLLPLRALGRTGEHLPLLGLGGWHVGRMEEAEAAKTVEVALEEGIRFFDTAEGYQDGVSEERLGRYLTSHYRDVAFLMTKTSAKDAAAARRHLDESLRRLRTDYLDLWQMHAVRDEEDVQGRLREGVLDVMEEAKATGKVRYIGFTGHRTPAAHLRVLHHAAAFDTCQMPVNVVDASREEFVQTVLPHLVARGIGVLAMKTLANGGFFGGHEQGEHGPCPCIVPDRLEVQEALRFAWSLPVDVLISGPDNADQLRKTAQIARAFAPMSLEEREALIGRVRGFDAVVEFYKANRET